MTWEVFGSAWQAAKTLANSNFALALLGSLGGAFAGAMGAQRVVEKSKERELALTQLRNTNAAIMVAFSVCNSLIAIKDQHAAGVRATFLRQRRELQEHMRLRDEGRISREQPFAFQADLRSLPPPNVPTDLLQAQVFERVSVTGRALALVTTLSQTVISLAGAISSRKGLIERFRATGGAANPEFLNLYFGMPSSSGHHSTEWPDAIEGIYNLTDDGIFFSYLLCRDLQDHAVTVLQQYRARFKDESQSVSRPDLEQARNAGLIPSDANYQDWLRAFGTGSR